MALTTAQQQALKADIAADVTLNALPNNSDSSFAIAAAYNTVGTFVVWKSSTSAADIFDQIVWANMTPADTPDTTQIWLNRNMQCQSKQLNLQTMLVGRDQVNSGKANVRTGLQDALTNVPSGAAGALQSAGWTNVRLTMQRNATRAEKLFATGTGTQGSPAVLVFEGSLSYQDIDAARNS